MLVIEMNLSIFSLAGLMLAALVLGFLLRTGQIRIQRRKILELEKEMLNNHAQILELEKEKAGLMRQMKEQKIPVIPMEGDQNESRIAR
jgi:hypothetical protein